MEYTPLCHQQMIQHTLLILPPMFQVQEMSQPPAPEDHGHGHDDGDPEPPEADQGYEAQFDDGFDLGEDYVGTEDNYPGYVVYSYSSLWDS